MSDKKCDHNAEHKEVLGHVLCVCCSHCQKENSALKSKLEKAREALEKISEKPCDCEKKDINCCRCCGWDAWRAKEALAEIGEGK